MHMLKYNSDIWRAVSSKPMEGKFFYECFAAIFKLLEENNIAENSRSKTRIFEFIKQKISVFTVDQFLAQC